MEESKICINSIEYTVYMPNNKDNLTDVIIFCVGFKTKTYSNTIKNIISKLVENNYIVVYFEFEKMAVHSHKVKGYLNLEKFMDKLNIIYTFFDDKYQNSKISIISTGLGAYVTLAAIQEYEIDFNKIILDTPAINLKELFRIKIGKYDLNDLYKIDLKKQNRKNTENIIYFFNDTIRKDLFKSKKKLNNVTIFHDKDNLVTPVSDSIKYIEYFCDNSKVITKYNSKNIENELVNVLNLNEEKKL